MRVAALIVGIDGWERYTLPLVQSLERHEPDCEVVVVDNASPEPYPALPYVHRTERLCYAAAINTAQRVVGEADWYLVLSNDVVCTGPFMEMLYTLGDVVAGPKLCENQGWTYIEGWCVFAPARVWQSLDGWDEGFRVSSWEDVDFSVSAVENGYGLAQRRFPFIHLDQRQRFGLIPDYWSSEVHNMQHFATKRKQAQA